MYIKLLSSGRGRKEADGVYRFQKIVTTLCSRQISNGSAQTLGEVEAFFELKITYVSDGLS
jgi:hypothetical protein